ncbi:MAG: hypothetical protein AB4050_18150 [Synechococcus sp.]
MGKIFWTLEAINERLNKLRVTVRQKGDVLYLRATLPPQSGEMKPKRRDLPMARATEVGFKFAEEWTHELEADRHRYRRDEVFDWEKWSGEDSSRQATASVPIK